MTLNLLDLTLVLLLMVPTSGSYFYVLLLLLSCASRAEFMSIIYRFDDYNFCGLLNIPLFTFRLAFSDNFSFGDRLNGPWYESIELRGNYCMKL